VRLDRRIFWTVASITIAVSLGACSGRSLPGLPAMSVSRPGTEWWCAEGRDGGVCFASQSDCETVRASLSVEFGPVECTRSPMVFCINQQLQPEGETHTVCLSDLASCETARATILEGPVGRVSACGMVVEPGYAACMPPVGYVRCTFDSECGDYRCSGGQCRLRCASSSDCSLGLACSSLGACIRPGTCGTCQNDSHCDDLFGCNRPRNECRTWCATNYECRDPHVNVCVAGRCLRPGTEGICRDDSHCGNYRCRPDHRCATSCSSNYDCRFGRCRQATCR
jgi:hypothetical protein